MPTADDIDDGLRERLRTLAELRHQPPSALVREAVREFVEREEAKEHFRNEALASWETYQRTGLHLTSDEVRSWLETWGTDRETALPECHD